MECRSLDLTIISAEDLKYVQLIGKQDLYAVVSINGDARTKQTTKVDKDCSTKPKWRQQMKLTVDDAAARENRLTLVFEIVANRPIAGDKSVGEVSVPVKELLDQNKFDEEKTVTYAVRLPNGKAKGSLKFSFRFGDKYTFGSSSAPHAPLPSALDHKTMDHPVTAYPPGHGAPSAYPPPPADAGPLHNKRQKEASLSPSSSSRLSLLPDDVALNCLSRLSRLDIAAFSLTSKSHRSLVASPEFCRTRELMGCTEEYCYVCLSLAPDPTPRWFILRLGGPTLDSAAVNKYVNQRLRPLPSYLYQPPESSSFVVLDYGIYIIGGIINGSPTSDVLLLDCLSLTWRRVRSMRVARASAAANSIDGKIYVFGGCEEIDSSNWAEVFDPKTQTWDTLPLPEDPEIRQNTRMIDKSVVLEDKVYAVDEEGQSFYYLPSEGIWRRGSLDSKQGNRSDWCALGKLLFCFASRGRILWCEPDVLDWKEVKGLDVVQWRVFGLKANNPAMDWILARKLHMIEHGFSRLSSNSRGNIVVFWRVHIRHTELLELWCAEISLETREGGEIWGIIEWADAVSQLDPFSYNVKVL